MRYFFALCAFLMLSLPLYVRAEELQDIRDALGSGDYIFAVDGLLDYLERFPDRTEHVEQIITTISYRTERQRVVTDQLLKQLQRDPENTVAIQDLAATVESRGAVFGLDLELDYDALLDISLSAQEHRALDELFARIEREVDAERFSAALELISDALVVGQDRLATSAEGQLREQVLAVAAEIERIVERFRSLYTKQLLPAARRAKAASARAVRRRGEGGGGWRATFLR